MANDRSRFPELREAPGAPGSSGVTQDTVVVSDFGGLTLDERTRTSAAGNTAVRYSLSIEAEPILNIFDGVQLGAGPANAIRDILERQARAIPVEAAPGTILRRKTAANALARGAAWAVRRYTGGRTGPTVPGQANGDGTKYGNDSGRLAGGWFVRQNPVEQAFTVNVPANRFDPSTWGGPGFMAFIEKFVSLVPALRDPRSILGDDGFVRAVGESKPVRLMSEASARTWRAYANVARAARGFVQVLVGG